VVNVTSMSIVYNIFSRLYFNYLMIRGYELISVIPINVLHDFVKKVEIKGAVVCSLSQHRGKICRN
jgi:hypothetical protein